MSKKITVGELQIGLDQIHENDYVSLTDLAKRETGEPKDLIGYWLKNASTILFLEAWEELNNPDFKGAGMGTFKAESLSNRSRLSPQRYLGLTDGIGLVSKSGRYGGGTWAHKDIALEFLTWLDPRFKVYFIKEFQRLKEEEAHRASIEWPAERVKDLLDEARNWMDMIHPPSIESKKN